MQEKLIEDIRFLIKKMNVDVENIYDYYEVSSISYMTEEQLADCKDRLIGFLKQLKNN